MEEIVKMQNVELNQHPQSVCYGNGEYISWETYKNMEAENEKSESDNSKGKAAD